MNNHPVCSKDKFIVDDDDMDSDTVAESDMSFISRSFSHRVNDRARKIQDQSSKYATQDSTSILVMENVYVFDIASICIHGGEFLRHMAFHQKYRRSHNETIVRHI